MIRCKKCNSENVNNAKYCRSCGSKLIQQEERASSSDLKKQSEKHSNIFLCVLSIIGFITGVAGFFMGWPHALCIGLVLGCSRAAAYYA